MKTKKTLPKTVREISNGGIYVQRVRCGKSNCRCAQGEKHLGHYFFTRVNGKLKKTYVQKSQLEEFSTLLAEALSASKLRRWTAQKSIELSAELRSKLSEGDTVITALRGIHKDG